MRDSGRSPAGLIAHSNETKQFEYVVADSALYVYSIDHANRLIQTVTDFLEIDWRHGRPLATTRRYGIGYARRPPG